MPGRRAVVVLDRDGLAVLFGKRGRSLTRAEMRRLGVLSQHRLPGEGDPARPRARLEYTTCRYCENLKIGA
jgi:hypothetical protein